MAINMFAGLTGKRIPMFIVDDFLTRDWSYLKDIPGYEPKPEDIPVSIIDIERLPPMNMELPVRDNCPVCGGNNMHVGDYVCWGFCWGCYREVEKQFLVPPQSAL